ncbi:MAG TPA: hypothetical protein VN371_08805 [Chlorobaculum sp.]|nr:hypothetical protein [Chlorobaculum sp.]
MKALFSVLVFIAVLGVSSVPTYAADPVDLSGKKGIVDPNDLKKDDPKPQKTESKPQTQTSNSTSTESTTPPQISGSASGSAGSGGGVNVPITKP